MPEVAAASLAPALGRAALVAAALAQERLFSPLAAAVAVAQAPVAAPALVAASAADSAPEAGDAAVAVGRVAVVQHDG